MLRLERSGSAAQRLLLLIGVGVVGAMVALPASVSVAGWSSTGSMVHGRALFTATTLENGRILATGGAVVPGSLLPDSELFDPVSQTWSASGSMSVSGFDQTATRLADGRVLVAGGKNPWAAGFRLDHAELYNPATGTWSATARLLVARFGHTATLLNNGKVLVAGGATNDFGDSSLATAESELYDPTTGTWTRTGDMNVGRVFHQTILLPDGRVLVSGGIVDSHPGITAAAEVYDPATGAWTPTGSLNRGRYGHGQVLLKNGKVLAFAGVGQVSGAGVNLNTAETYDPTVGVWTATGSFSAPGGLATGAMLPDGRVLGTTTQSTNTPSPYDPSTNVYDPATGEWSSAGNLLLPRQGQAAVALDDGRVLVAGGNIAGDGGLPTTTAEIYTTAVVRADGLDFGDQTVGHRSAALPVLVTNTGTSSLTMGAAAIGPSGSNPTDFALATDRCARRTLRAGQSCSIGVRFTPSGKGVRTGTLVLTYNAAGSPQSVRLAGTGVTKPSGGNGGNGRCHRARHNLAVAHSRFRRALRAYRRHHTRHNRMVYRRAKAAVNRAHDAVDRLCLRHPHPRSRRSSRSS